MSTTLLTRDEWRKQIFARDEGSCVGCGEDGTAAHHIIERRLWGNGGYYLDNGALLCGDCHLHAESTVLSASEIRARAGIKEVLIPDSFFPDNRYDKWGNVILDEYTRVPGPLYWDEGVQKILRKDVTFQKYMKYPRTMHLAWSPNLQNDDRRIEFDIVLRSSVVVVTEKMDGENTSMYDDNIHARSVNSGDHPSRKKMQEIFSYKRHDIPPDLRICGENVYAKHSIQYTDLEDYFLVFNMWRGDYCLDWPETLEWAELLDLTVVPVLWTGLWDEEKLHEIERDYVEPSDNVEGYVVRTMQGFHYKNFQTHVAKYVRKNHVRSDEHWMHQEVVPNELRSG